MSTVKISQLPNLTHLDSNTANTILVGIDNTTSVTSQFTARVLADSLYSNNALNVGNNSIILPDVIAQFSGNSESYLQTNLQNRKANGSGDYVVTADVGSDTKNYIDLGLAGSNNSVQEYSSILPLDGYLYVQGNTAATVGGNLIIGTGTSGKTINIIAGGTTSDKVVVKISSDGVNLVSKPLTFADGSTQNTSTEATASFANSAYSKANSAGVFANGAFVQSNNAFGAANAASLFANGAFVTTNASFTRANSSFEAANLAIVYGSSAGTFANGAFVKANASFTTANSSFDASNVVGTYANTAITNAGAASSFANGAFVQANTSTTNAAAASLFANGAFVQSNTATTNAGAASTFANGAFTQANSSFLKANSAGVFANGAFDAANVVFTAANAASLFANGAFTAANTAANTGTAAGLFANGAFATANNTANNASAAYTKANSAYTLAGTQAGRLDIIEPIAQAAFTNAAAALANTTGTFDGDLTITGFTRAQAVNTGNLIVAGTANVSGTLNVVGSVSMNATLVLANSNFTATESAVTIAASPTVATPSNDGYMIHISGKNGIPTRIVSDAYGAGAYSVYASRSARGTIGSPTAVQSGDIMGRFSANGYGTTKWQQFGTGRIDFVASENYTDAHTGSQIQFWNCPVGSNTLTNILTLNGNSAEFTGEVNPQKGFVYTPNVIAGITTTLNIDIANTSLYYFKTNATTTISLSGFKNGKIIEVWLTNTDTGPGSNHTITHGCLANNSTIGATSFTLTSLHSAYIKYFSIDGDLANTFCQVTYS